MLEYLADGQRRLGDEGEAYKKAITERYRPTAVRS